MSWADFIDIGGRGAFIWGAFGAFIMALLFEVLWLRARNKRVLAALKDHQLAAAARGNKR